MARTAAAPVFVGLAILLLAPGPVSAVALDLADVPVGSAPAAIESRPTAVQLPADPRIYTVDANASILPSGMEHRVTSNGSPQNEVSIALNPRNPRNIVVTANDYRPGYLWCGVYTSMDGGHTWLEQLVPHNGSLTFTSFAGDASAAFDAAGNAYVSCLGVGNGSVVTVSKSTDGGFTWGTPREVAGFDMYAFHDKPYIAVDQSYGPTRGYVYVTWTRFLYDYDGYLLESPIYFSRSTDGGAMWSAGLNITGPGYARDQGSQPAVGPAGELYVSWVARDTNNNYRIEARRSLDGGLTWGPVWIVDAMWNPGALYSGGRPRTPHLPSIAVNPIDGPDGNLVHIVWADRRLGDADILMSTSADGGATWGPPVRVNDDATGNAQFFPWVAASTNGKVFVVFYDRRDDPGDRLLTVYLAVSTDFGASFTGNLRVGGAQFDPGTWFIGDYIGVAASGDFAFPAWCDLRNGGDEEVYMAGPAFLDTGGRRMMTP